MNYWLKKTADTDVIPISKRGQSFMSKVFDAARTCVIRCSNSDTPYRDVEAFCTELRHQLGWTPHEVDEVQEHALRAILNMKRQANRDATGA